MKRVSKEEMRKRHEANNKRLASMNKEELMKIKNKIDTVFKKIGLKVENMK